MTAYWLTGDTRDVTAAIPDGTIDLIVTSPPFLALRSYLPADHPDKHREIGSEATPAAFTSTLLELSAEWRRILAPHGSLCVELGDTYSGSSAAEGQPRFRVGYDRRDGRATMQADDYAPEAFAVPPRDQHGWPDAKCLALIPELYRIALAYGTHPLTGQPSPAGRWKVRNVVRWVRPNPPVGALGDKFRPATSDMVVACTSGKRWFDLDAVRTEPVSGEAGAETGGSRRNGGFRGVTDGGVDHPVTVSHPAGAPPLDWWKISPGGFSGSHYAVFPGELVERPIDAMCPRRVCRTCGTPSKRLTVTTNAVGQAVGRRAWRENGTDGVGAGHVGEITRSVSSAPSADVQTLGWSTCGCPGTTPDRIDGHHTDTGWRAGRVLDPFGGSGTVGIVATGRGRDAILIDLDSRNLDLARERIGMFLEETTPADLAAILNPTSIAQAS